MTLVTVKEIPKKGRKKNRNNVSQMIEEFYNSKDTICMVVCSIGEYKNFMSEYQSIRHAVEPYKNFITIHAIDNDVYLEKVF